MVTFLMEIIRLNCLPLMFFLLSNNYIELVTCDPLLEIPFIKKTIQENRKKMWHDYHHKFLVQCMDGRNIHKSSNILSAIEVLQHLYQCLVTQHEEIYKAPQHFKKIKIINWDVETLNLFFSYHNRSISLK